jgi:NADPH:quinone reductase-like Zn-dependent oxidoreductase
VRAALLDDPGATPVVADFREPEPTEGSVLIDVVTAGLGGWDVLGAYREAVEFPCVIRGEGIGRAEDGRRVYFGERSLRPFGAWAERTVVPAAEVWDVPDGVDDVTAINAAIAGTGAWVPLEQAAISQGESVLILGATGALGQLALQYARILGAGRVVGAGRNAAALETLTERGVADAVVALGTEDDAAALRAESGGDGYDVVLDVVYGEPFVSALKATRWGARVMTIGVGAGPLATVFAGDMLFRTHTTVGTGQRPPEDRERIWLHLIDLAREHGITVSEREYSLEEAAQAWELQKAGPHAKVIGRVAQ